MQSLKLLLIPFAWLYGLVVRLRHYMFNKGILRSTTFHIPLIGVGNLSFGGTGKTPLVEYLIRLLYEEQKIATLSRGYKRKTKGFVLADENTTASDIGDEPFQFKSKFENIQVADVVKGVTNVNNNQTGAHTSIIIEYHLSNSNKIKKINHLMDWWYNEEYKTWYTSTPLPDFKN